MKGGLFYATPQNRGNVQVDKTSWAPRLGLAYRVFPKTVIRTGFGMFFSVWWQPFVRATGFASNTAMVTTLDGGRLPTTRSRIPSRADWRCPPGRRWA